MFLQQYVFKNPLKRAAVRLLDAFGALFLGPFKARWPAFRPEAVRRILVIRLDHIGDVIMTRPAVSLLRTHFPLASIEWLVSGDIAPLLAGDLRVADRVIPMHSSWFSRRASLPEMLAEARRIRKQIRLSRYDLAIDFRGDIRNLLLVTRVGIPWRIGYGITGGGFLLTQTRPYDRRLHQMDLNADLLGELGITRTPDIPPFHTRLEIKSAVLEALSALPGKKILIQTGAGYPSKIWPQESFGKLIGMIHAAGLGRVILIGTEAEKKLLPGTELPREGILDLRGKTPLEELPALFDACDLFIGNDSGPAHIAAAQGIPVLCLFSAVNDDAVWKPRGPRVRVITRQIACSPCLSRECPLGHHRCMRDITPAEVFEIVRQQLEGGKRHASF